MNRTPIVVAVEHFKLSVFEQPFHGRRQNGLIYPRLLGFWRLRKQFRGIILPIQVAKTLSALNQGAAPLQGTLARPAAQPPRLRPGLSPATPKGSRRRHRRR